MEEQKLCDCLSTSFLGAHTPHSRLFCRAPVEITDPEFLAVLRQPPRPLKTTTPIVVVEDE